MAGTLDRTVGGGRKGPWAAGSFPQSMPGHVPVFLLIETMSWGYATLPGLDGRPWKGPRRELAVAASSDLVLADMVRTRGYGFVRAGPASERRPTVATAVTPAASINALVVGDGDSGDSALRATLPPLRLTLPAKQPSLRGRNKSVDKSFACNTLVAQASTPQDLSL